MKPSRRYSLTFRMTVAVGVFYLLFFAVLTGLEIHYFKQEFKKSISDQQFTLLSVIAQDIDRTLLASSQVLIDVSRNLPLEVVNDAEAAQRFLDDRFGTHSLFDNGLFLFSADGRIIAESPYRPDRRGRDISFRPYYQKTIETKRPVISDPYDSTHTPGAPAVIFTVPIIDKNGQLLAILGGSLNLLNDNFIGNYARTRIAETGYLYLFNHSRTIIIHPDKSRILTESEPPGVNRLFDAALNGFEGSGENVNSRGLESLASFKHLQSVDWIMGANYPLVEAYAPIQKIQQRFFLYIGAGLLIGMIVVKLLMERYTRNLVQFARHVRDLADKEGEERIFPCQANDEVGSLVQTFNVMIQNEDRKSAELFHASTHDALTGLYNRAYFDSELDRLSRGRQGPISVVVADIDRLKECNDTEGHAAGDALIKGAAKVLLESFRAEDIVARIGGDEFAALLPGVGAEHMTLTLERVREAEAQMQGLCPLSISLGMATSASADGLFEAFRHADQAMYDNKAARRKEFDRRC